MEQSLPWTTSSEDLRTAVRLMRESELLDAFLHVKFRQLKRYSLEGCEAMLPGVWALLDESSRLGVKEVVVGMAHRVRDAEGVCVCVLRWL